MERQLLRDWPEHARERFMYARLTITLTLILAALSAAQVIETGPNGQFAHPLGLHDETDYVLIEDLNGDGRDDVLSPTGVYLADGQGAFTFTPIPPLIVAARNAAVGDLDGDGDVDIYAGLQVLLNDGAGAFTPLPGAVPPPPYVGPCSHVSSHRSPVMADLDGDGDVDVFVSRWDECTHSHYGRVFLNDGTGMLTEYAGAGTLPVRRMAHAAGDDVDGDGDVDIVVISNDAAILYLNDGTGRLVAGPTLWTGQFATAGATGDIDGDGRLDHVFHDGHRVIVLQRTANGFSSSVASTPATFTVGMTLIDVDLDGSVEVCRADAHGLSVSDFTSAGAVSPELFRRSIRGRDVHVGLLTGDVDGDGFDDVVAQFEGRTTTFLGDGQGSIEELQRHDIIAAIPIVGAAADFDGDGDIDLLARQPAPGGTRIGILENDGYGRFAFAMATSFVTAMSVGESGHVFDGNADGKPDVIISSQEAIQAMVLLNISSGFVLTTTLGSTAFAAQVEFADFDADGDDDLLVTRQGSNPSPMLIENLGSLTFAPARHIPTLQMSVRDSAVGDVDGDGFPDILLCFSALSPELLLNDGTGHFTVAQTLRPTNSPVASTVTLGDYDQDGWVDATIDRRLWLNDGTGVMNLHPTFAFGIYGLGGYGAWADDLNGDGLTDYCEFDGRAALNRGGLIFQTVSLSSRSPDAYGGQVISRPVLADIDRDGDLDLLYDGYVERNYAVQLSSRGHRRLGSSLKIDLHAHRPGGAAYWLLASLIASDQPAAPFGDLFVSPTSSILVDSGLVTTPGLRTTDVPIPANPALAGVDIHWQALHLDVEGLRLGNLLTTTLRP